MGKLAKGNITTTVTKIEAGDLPAASFDIPADYKTKTRTDATRASPGRLTSGPGAHGARVR